jgi:hypothetical protein
MGADEANIQASLCAAIRIAKERNSVSLEKRAEATYAGVPSPKSERVRRKWISSTFLVTCLQRPDFFNDFNCRVVRPRFVDSFL